MLNESEREEESYQNEREEMKMDGINCQGLRLIIIFSYIK